MHQVDYSSRYVKRIFHHQMIVDSLCNNEAFRATRSVASELLKILPPSVAIFLFVIWILS
jgi:hypothetical protein